MLYFRTHAQHADTRAGSTNDEKNRDKRRPPSNQFRLIISIFLISAKINAIKMKIMP